MIKDNSINKYISNCSAVGNNDLGPGLSLLRAQTLQLFDEVLSFDHFTENAVFSVEPGARDKSNEELTSIGVGSGVGHRKEERLGVFDLKVFISKLGSVDGFTTSAVFICKVSTLSHELGNDSVERASFVTKTVLASA